MTVTIYRRPARRKPPEMPSGELVLQEPPSTTESTGNGLSGMLFMIPMALGGLAMMAMVGIPIMQGGVANISSAIMPMAFGLMIMSSMFMGFGRNGNRRGKLRGERRDYLRYLGQIRKQVRDAASEQRTALLWRHPDPEGLWSVALTGRLWERRRSHADFAEVRVSRCEQRLALTIKPLQTKPVEDLEPLSARALRRFIAAYGTVGDLPTAIFLRGFAHVQLEGGTGPARGLTRAILMQLVTFHSPDDLRVIICASADRASEWDWVKWLPHAQHTSDQDGAGAARMFVDGTQALDELLTRELDQRTRFEAGAAPERDEPYAVVVLDGVDVTPESRLAGAGYRNTVIVAVTAETALPRGRGTLRLDVRAEKLDMVNTNRTGEEIRTSLGCPDSLSVARATSLARTISPYRLGATHEVVEPMITDFDLSTLLGVGDIGELNPAVVWRRTAATADRFRVPIGIAEDGKVVELDIKEAAQGGMGPHGLLIGATGSGKSELLRTLVLALAITHSSEYLNFVLTDFKGGATFLGLDELPHTSAVITNLADEEGLVIRMQDAIQGELIRRQELLRRAGNYSSLLEYETARKAGTPLDPLPTLFVVVDEFSELIANHPDFVELFVMIGRVGRSLGVHLLLASQRIDEGRIHKLESHLSYRISLRTFSAMESRSVIGVPDAYQLPNTPGSGYIRTDVLTLIRFKAAYVSGRYQRRTLAERQAEVRRQVVAFGAGRVSEVELEEPAAPMPTGPTEDAASESLLRVAVSRLKGQGPPAHQVWLPPLTSPATLDQVLPPLLPDAELGLTTATWPGRGGLNVPVGVIDKPYEQLRDLLMLDLSGAGGHVGIAGGPQAGKSTMLRSLIAVLALTHTPAEVQFYCLDFGGGSLASLAGLPHVGGIANRMQPERVSRTVAEVQDLMARRERMFTDLGLEGMPAFRAARAAGLVDDPYGDVFLCVDGWASLRADFEEQDQMIRQISGRGLNYGVHLVLTTSRWSEVNSGLRDQLGTKVKLRLGEAIDSLIDIRAANTVPRQSGRGLTMDKLHYLATIPRIDGRSSTDDLTDAVRAMVEAVADNWTGPPAPPVRLLPSLLPAAELPPAQRSGPGGSLRLALGLAERDFQPVWHDFAANPHLTVIGDNASGKTAVLRLVVRALIDSYTPDEVQLVVLDSRRALLEHVPQEYRAGTGYTGPLAAEVVNDLSEQLRARLPGAEITQQQLARRDWWTGPEYYIVVDDYDLLMGSRGSGPLDAIVDLVPVAGDIGLHIVLTRPAAGSSRLSMDSVIRRLQESNTPDLALSVPTNEMPLLNGMRPRPFPPGRGMVVTRRAATQLQIGWTEP